MNSSYNFDPDQCEIEPIHTPGTIQPFGAVIATDKQFNIHYASANTSDFFSEEPTELFGKPLNHLMNEKSGQYISQYITQDSFELPLYLQVITNNGKLLELYAYNNGDMYVFEFEQEENSIAKSKENILSSPYRRLQRHIEKVKSTTTLSELCQLATQVLHELLGHDRVLAYQFDEVDQHGEVIAEVVQDGMRPMLGLHYPASDIPPQARELFLQNNIRMIPDIHYQPINIVAINKDVPPLDMGLCLTRGVFAGHLAYLEHMGSTASMTLTIEKEGRLWGLFACHHSEPLYITRSLRDMCRFFSTVFAAQIATIEEKERAVARAQRLTDAHNFIRNTRNSDDLFSTIADHPDDLMKLIPADGLTVVSRVQTIRAGTTPSQEFIDGLVQWLDENTHQNNIFHTSVLSELYPESEAHKELASGLFCISFKPIASIYILWFRKELRQTVKWGRPVQSITGSPKLGPERSFTAWEQEVSGKSRYWTHIDHSIAQDIWNDLVDVRLQQLIQRSEYQLKSLINGIPEMVFVMVQDSVKFINSTVEELTGYDIEALQDGYLQTLFPDDLPDSGQQKEIEFTTKNGEVLVLLTTSVPFTFEELPARLLFCTNITSHKKLENERIQIEVERQRMKVLTEFVQGASHDFRTPLSIIHSSIYMIKRMTSDERIVARLSTIEHQSKYVNRLVDSLMAMVTLDSREKFNLILCDVNTMLVHISTRLRPQAETKSIQFMQAFEQALSPIYADEFELERAFSNVIDNAIKYSPEYAIVTITTRQDDDRIKIIISDTGDGIAPEHLPLIFKRFYRVDKAREIDAGGTGLGLSITQKIIEIHNGDISVASTVGEGTIFTISLPIS